ncbi:hypothetical protein V8B97DRAFT_1867380 [Scleroderma yunnanense]
MSHPAIPQTLALRPHPTARDKTVSTTKLLAGTPILTVPCLSKVLLPDQKQYRCDFCFRIPDPDHDNPLRRCTGCVSYLYCDNKCQTSHWRTHKKYCKNFNQYSASRQFAQLESYEKLDAMLLTHFLAELSARDTEKANTAEVDTFMSLLPGPVSDSGITSPPTCPLATNHKRRVPLDELFSRCGNNNFTIHSHFTTIAHGIFPLASRLFNHSCLPNAIAKYIFNPAEEVQMVVVAIRDIPPGEEICITYVDPALLETRQKMFQITYGFTCTCASCRGLDSLITPRPSIDLEDTSAHCAALCRYVFPVVTLDNPTIHLPTIPPDFSSIPPQIRNILQESFLTKICELFRNASHDGPLEVAQQTGLAVLAFYVLIYPPNYPQIGMHTLEMAKTAWNAIITSESAGSLSETLRTGLLKQVRACLDSSRRILDMIGSEGDAGGPLTEIEVLSGLLNSEEADR